MFSKIEVLKIATHMLIIGYALRTFQKMLHEDMLGLEKYIQFVESDWVDLSPWWGGVFVVITVISLTNVYHKIIKRKRQDIIQE